MVHRIYEQEFSFLYQFGQYENKLMRVESYTPLCTNETNSNILTNGDISIMKS